MTRRPTHLQIDWLLLGGLVAGHLALGLSRFPSWMFGKYPAAASLLRGGKMAPEIGGDFSPLYLLANLALEPSALRLAQSLLGGLGVIAVFMIGRRAFGRLEGHLGALLFASSLPLFLYEATLEPDLAIAVLDVGAIALLVSTTPEHRWPTALAGALLGLSAALRPTALLLLAGIVAWLLVDGRHRWPLATRGGRATLLLGTAIALTLLPLLVVRASAGPELGATMSPGAVIHMGNRPEGTGLGTQPPLFLKLLERQQASPRNPDSAHALYRAFARAEAGSDLSATETELFWIKKTAAFALWEPWAFARLIGRKVFFLLVGPEGYDLVEVRRSAESAGDLPLPDAPLLGLLGIAGLAAMLVRRRVEPFSLVAVLYVVAISCAFYVVSRYRLVAVPYFCVGSAFLLSTAVAAWRDRRARAALAISALVALSLWWGSDTVRLADRSLARTAVASNAATGYDRLVRAGQLARATEQFIDIQAASPFTLLMRDVRGVPFERQPLVLESARRSAERFGTLHDVDAFYLAELATMAGRCDQALPVFEQLGTQGFHLAVFDHLLEPNLMAARCLLVSGRQAEARAAIGRSLEAVPGTLEGLSLAIAGSEALGEEARARAAWVAELEALHDRSSAGYALAEARLAWGQFETALSSIETVLAAVPDSGSAHYVRGLALAGLGRNREALMAYDRALALFPRHAFRTRPFHALVVSALDESPDDPTLLSLAAEHFLRRGALERAVELADRASRLLGPRSTPTDRDRIELIRQAALAQATSTQAPLRQ